MKHLGILILILIGLSSCSKEDSYIEDYEEDTFEPTVVVCDSMQIYTEALDYPFYSRVDLSVFSVINGVPPYQYEWSNGETGPMISVFTNGNYGVTVTDDLDCIASQEIVVDQIQNPCAGFSVRIVEVSSGNLEVQITGGTSPYTYAWNTGQISANITVAIDGNYSVTVTDFNGCEEVAEIDVSLSDPCSSLDVHHYTWEPTTEKLDIFVVGGTPPYYAEWSNGALGMSITAPAGYLYTVTVTDAVNCRDSLDIQL